MENKILQGDCIEEMKKLEDNSIDAIITDPPYELGFMGKGWDGTGIAYNVDLWKEALRVLKSGGFLLSFGGTRTYHRMAVAIEDAGFEIRDTIMWLYGSGFPKSLNIGKQIDKMQGNERKVVGIDKQSSQDLRDVGKKVKEIEGIDKLSFGLIENAERKNLKITKGNSQWEGWGTSIKPAHEPIVVARKPLSEKNVALNVLKWGTGGINIDGCRIGYKSENDKSAVDRKNKIFQGVNNKDYNGIKFVNKERNLEMNQQGRFPANIILDEEAGKMLDEQTEGKVGNGHWSKTKVTGFGEFGSGKSEYYGVGEKDNDKGGASRFFYCAKASKSERNYGCKEMEDKENSITNQSWKCKICNKFQLSENQDICKCKNPEWIKPISKNNHPTVKPIKLMEYLIKLVTKKGATVLDPFLGSGTTAIACIKQQRNIIGIEKEEEYIKIIKARLKPYLEQRKLI